MVVKVKTHEEAITQIQKEDCCICIYTYLCVCVCEKERERERSHIKGKVKKLKIWCNLVGLEINGASLIIYLNPKFSLQYRVKP